MTQDHIAFCGKIVQNGNINAAYIEFPFSTEEVYGKKGQVKIKVLFDNQIEYRGTLAKMKSNCHILGVTQEIRTKLGKSFGDEVWVKIWEDKEERIVEIPEDVQMVFNENVQAKDAKTFVIMDTFIPWFRIKCTSKIYG